MVSIHRTSMCDAIAFYKKTFTKFSHTIGWFLCVLQEGAVCRKIKCADIISKSKKLPERYSRSGRKIRKTITLVFYPYL